MKRYIANKIVKNLKGEEVFATSKLPTIKRDSSDRYIISREGDRLDLLANQFYEDARFWPAIALANNLGKGSLVVPPGLQIRLPNITNIDEFENLFEEQEENR